MLYQPYQIEIMQEAFTEAGKLYLSKAYLRDKGISENTIKSIWHRNVGDIKYVNSFSFINYDNIPDFTSNNLPSKLQIVAECHISQTNQQVATYIDKIKFLVTKGCVKYRNEYKEQYKISHENALKAAQLKAFWQWVVDECIRDTSNLFEAFNKVMPGKYKSYAVFNNVKSRAVNEGVENAAFDKRWIEAPKNVKHTNPCTIFWIAAIGSIGKKYTAPDVLKKITPACVQDGIKPPSIRAVQYIMSNLKTNAHYYQSRYGSSKTTASKMPYSSMQHALYALDQLQTDGWNVPFYIIGSNGKAYRTPVIYLLRDAYSKKIVGYAIGETENTLLIMEALKATINNTAMLPFEFLMDKHSFTKTKEFEHVEKEIKAIGGRIEVSMEATRKAITERYFQDFEPLCKEYHGYNGQGIRSVNKDARPSQEYFDKHVNKASEQLTLDEVKLMFIKMVDVLNNTVHKGQTKTPNQLFDESEKPNAFPLTLSDRIKILSPSMQWKVTRGQIDIVRSGFKHEFQVSTDTYNQYNDKTVTVRYEDLKDCIYLFDASTDAFIETALPKRKIHGAIANQTDKDIKLFHQQKGRIESIKAKSKKQFNEINKEAISSNPKAVESLSNLLTSKEVLQDIKQDAQLKMTAIDLGIDLDNTSIPARQNEINLTVFKPEEKKSKGPFKPDKDHVFRKIDLSEFDDNDED